MGDDVPKHELSWECLAFELSYSLLCVSQEFNSRVRVLATEAPLAFVVHIVCLCVFDKLKGSVHVMPQ